MTRVVLIGFVLLTVACGNKSFESLCANQVPPPAACNTPCETAPGAPNNCPGGYHCSPGGKCDQFCTLGGSQCGDGYTCTADGLCVASGTSTPDSGPDPDTNCPAVHVTAMKTTPTVELLLDQSSSMNANYGNNGTAKPTRWEAMRTALIDAQTGVVAKLSSQVVFGVTLYTSTGTPCPLLTTRPRTLDNYVAIRDLLNGEAPKDNTPTGESIDAIVADFAAHAPATGSPPIIVLATDGLPDTCALPSPGGQQAAVNASTVMAAQRAYAAGIKLFFLFVGDATAAGTHPKQMANAGAGLDPVTGDAPFYVATNPLDLASAFSMIIGGTLTCDIRLDGQVDPADAPNGVVTVNSTVLTYSKDWNLDADGITIHVIGDACTMLKNAAAPTIDAAFPCGTIIL